MATKSRETCEHPPEECITWPSNSASGCGGRQDREITTCTKCGAVISTIQIE